MKQALRIFPTLTILNNDLVKTVDYKNPRYLGDPINAIKLFNNKNVDEIAILDISSRFNKNSNEINYALLQEMAQEAFVPLSYGGNIKSAAIADKIINLGFEKIILNSLLFENPFEVEKIIKKLGSQSVVFKIDYTIQKGHFLVWYNEGKKIKEFTNLELVNLINNSGPGEVIFSRKDYDGKMSNFDLSSVKPFLEKINIPLVLCHGAKDKFSITNSSKYGFLNFTASSMYVFYGNLKGILINDPFFKL
jgi:cyclase